jgi:glycosyltransferase involved in cell wall biosynthesis
MSATVTPRTAGPPGVRAAGTRDGRRIALYYPWIYLTSGAERTILELTGRGRHDWTLFTNHYDPQATFPGFRDRRVVSLAPISVRRAIGPVARAAGRILTQRLPLDSFDALVVVCEGLGDLAVFRNARIPVICVCLTPLRAVFDDEYRTRAMATRTLAGRLAFSVAAGAFRAVDRLAWRRYQRVFCISEETRRRVVAGGLATPAEVEVLHVGLGVRGDRPSETFQPFFLIPGRVMWTKNIELGIAAFQRFRAAHPGTPFRLVVAGMVDAKSRPYLERLRELAGGDPAIEFRLAPTDEELADLYRTCLAVIFPSFNEDWGIVPLEGMAFGKPVVATDRGGPREVVHPGIDGFLEAPEPEAFARRLAQLADDSALARAMGLRGFARAALFTWDRFSARIDGALDDVIGEAGDERAADRRRPAAHGPAGARTDGRSQVTRREVPQ